MNDYALILAGGGGKGAYQIGVWRALREFGADKIIGAVAGTSVGALNGAMYVSGEYEKAVRLWRNIKQSDILTPFDIQRTVGGSGFLNTLLRDVSNFIGVGKTGFFSREGLSRIIRNNLNFKALRKSSMPFYITLFNRKTMDAEYILLGHEDTDEHIEKLLLASSAMPVVFGSENIGESTYYDGGLVDNCPIAPLYNDGYRKFIVVWLNNEVSAPVVEFSTEFPDAFIVNIIPSEAQGNFLTGTLDFSSTGVNRRMQLGYTDAVYALSAAFGNEESKALALLDKHAQEAAKRRSTAIKNLKKIAKAKDNTLALK